MNKKEKYLIGIISPTIIGLIITLILFIANLDPIIKTINAYEGTWIIIVIIIIRIILLAGMSAYMFKQWFNQEHQYLSDIPFLFALFFLLVIFGKSFDLLYNLTYYFTDRFTFLIILKVRFLIGALSLSPMYYLSIGMILFFLSLYEKYKKLDDKKVSNQIQLITLSIIILLISALIIIFLDDETNKIILPAIVIPSFLTIVLIFYFAYKNKRLSQVNPLILAIGFSAYLISQIIRPIFQIIFGNEVPFIFFSELLDLIIYFVIFIGLIKKIEYD